MIGSDSALIDSPVHCVDLDRTAAVVASAANDAFDHAEPLAVEADIAAVETDTAAAAVAVASYYGHLGRNFYRERIPIAVRYCRISVLGAYICHLTWHFYAASIGWHRLWWRPRQ